jgi:hypothetical protein
VGIRAEYIHIFDKARHGGRASIAFGTTIRAILSCKACTAYAAASQLTQQQSHAQKYLEISDLQFNLLMGSLLGNATTMVLRCFNE